MKTFAHTIKWLLLTTLLTSCALFLGPDAENDYEAMFDQVWNDFDENYGLMTVKGVDWDQARRDREPLLSNIHTEQEFYNLLCDLLGLLNDSHVYLMTGRGYFNSGDRYGNSDPFSLEVIRNHYLISSDTAGKGMFTWGEISGNIGYLHIAGFAHGDTGTSQSQDWVKDIGPILTALADTDGLVLDLRGNRGGLPSNVAVLSGRFASDRADYAWVRTKNGPKRNDFTEPVIFSINPSNSQSYTKPIVLLTNKQTISGGEWFTLALKTQPHVIHAGSITAGAMSLSLERPLANGWIYSVSVQKVLDKYGVCHEGTGLIPTHLSSNTEAGLSGGTDNQLEQALSLF